MEKEEKKNKKFIHLIIGACFLLAFLIFTILVKYIDVSAIGPNSSSVGFATINEFVHNLFGVHMTVYNITDWMGVIPIAIGLCFAVIGVIQWIKRKHFLQVDPFIFGLGILYIVTFGIYMLFNYLVINYRPVLINNVLEPSYPSSTTMLAIVFLISFLFEIKYLINNKKIRIAIIVSSLLTMAFMVIGRLVSGVHWFTDIFASILISVALIEFYLFLSLFLKEKLTKRDDSIDTKTHLE